MTTDVRSRIAPDNALVIYPRDFGSEVGPGELEALFLEFTSRHSDSQWQFELGPDGEIIAMGPVSHPGGFHENDAATDLRIWSREFGGESTGSNAFYRMPVTGGYLVPDAAWVSPQKLAAHPPVSGEPIAVCPDFVIEIRSGSDNLAPLQGKMRLYIENGALLGWLIDPRNRRVYVYRVGQSDPELLEDPATLSGENVLPGFAFNVAQWIFERT